MNLHTRRELLGAAALLGAATESPFRYRSLLGWITDQDSRPDENTAWPSMRLDETTMADYERTFDMMVETGFNQIVIWGLFVSDAWPLDITSAVTPQRGKLVERLVARASKRGIRVLNGLGVYSWGFRNIIAANPKLGPTSREAMCASEEESWDWMRKILDYTSTRFALDGVSMQSADRGRCTCDRCKRWTDAEYHSRINIRAAEYLRSKWPKQTLAVSGWGMNFEDPASQPHVVNLSSRIEYLIDVDGSTTRRDPAYRKQFVRNLKCGMGTLGGPQVEPPQHWKRDRWFLPTARHNAQHLAALKADGGRACEYFFHILANPGDELTQHVVGLCLSQPDVAWEKHLDQSIRRIYRLSNSAEVTQLAEAFLAAEDAYFNNARPVRDGTISMEPLVGSSPGPAIYLSKHMDAQQIAAYSRDLSKVADKFRALPPKLQANPRIALSLRCIANAQRDAAGIQLP